MKLRNDIRITARKNGCNSCCATMELVAMPKALESFMLICCLLFMVMKVEAAVVASVHDRPEFMKSDAACRVPNHGPGILPVQADSGKSKSADEFPYRTAIYAEAGGPAKAFSLNVEDTRLLGWPIKIGLAYFEARYTDKTYDDRYKTLLGVASVSLFGRHRGRNVDLQIGMSFPLWVNGITSNMRSGLFSPFAELSTIIEPKSFGIYIKLSATFAPLAEWPDSGDYGKLLGGIAIGYTL
jgi:hypothetical protein